MIGKIPDHIMGMCLIEYDNQLFLLCDDFNKGKIPMGFEDQDFQNCIKVSFMRGSIELLRICAKELTDSQKDFHVVNGFIDKIEEIYNVDSITGSIEVVE